MSKNTEREEIASAWTKLSRALQSAPDPGDGSVVILAGIVRGAHAENTGKVLETNLADQWHAFPADAALAESFNQQDSRENALCGFPVSPFAEARGALTRDMFLRGINSELLRINRNGGCLSLIGAEMTEKSDIKAALGTEALARLRGLLGEVLLSMLESCDSLGIMKNGHFACCLPGIGQLGARNFAEKAQLAFEKAASSAYPACALDSGHPVSCAFGIVNLMQGEKGAGEDLLQRARTTLEIALAKNNEHIHQESTFTPLDGATLVQSSEKRFLFFGGDPS